VSSLAMEIRVKQVKGRLRYEASLFDNLSDLWICLLCVAKMEKL